MINAEIEVRCPESGTSTVNGPIRVICKAEMKIEAMDLVPNLEFMRTNIKSPKFS